MKDVLQNIQNKLAEIPELKYIDEDWGQLDNYSPNPPTKFPFALIDITNVGYANLGIDRTATPQNRQTATGSVTITVGNLKLTNTGLNAPQLQKDKAWEVWDIIEKIHQKLHGFKPTNITGALIRNDLQRVVRDDGIQEYRINYTMGMTNV